MESQTEEIHREAGGVTEQLKRFTERQVESQSRWRESEREAGYLQSS